MATVHHDPSLVCKLKYNPRHGGNSNLPTLAQIDAKKRLTFRFAFPPQEEIISWIRALVLYGQCPFRLHLVLSPTPPPHHPLQTTVFLNYPLLPQRPPPMRKWTGVQTRLTKRKRRGRIR